MTQKSKKQPRRASMTHRAAHPMMLSWFSATENAGEKAAAAKEKKSRRRNSIATTRPRPSPPASPPPAPPPPPLRSPPTSRSPPLLRGKSPGRGVHQRGASPRRASSPSPHHMHHSQWLLDEVEITGLELLRKDRCDTEDSFSYESYAHDSFALQAQGARNAAALRSGLCHKTPSECRMSRRMSNCSSIGLDGAAGDNSTTANQQQYQIKGWSTARYNRRGSMGNSTLGSAAVDYNYGSQSPRSPRSSLMRDGSFARRLKQQQNQPPLTAQGQAGRRRMPRRGSTGTNDLPGFGAYKAKRRASMENGSSHRVHGEQPLVITTGVSATVGLLGDSSHHNRSHNGNTHGLVRSSSLRGMTLRDGLAKSGSFRGGSTFGGEGLVRSASFKGLVRSGSFRGSLAGSFSSENTFGVARRRGSMGSIDSFANYSRCNSMGSIDDKGPNSLRGSNHGSFRRMSIGSSINSSEGRRPRT